MRELSNIDRELLKLIERMTFQWTAGHFNDEMDGNVIRVWLNGQRNEHITRDRQRAMQTNLPMCVFLFCFLHIFNMILI